MTAATPADLRRAPPLRRRRARRRHPRSDVAGRARPGRHLPHPDLPGGGDRDRGHVGALRRGSGRGAHPRRRRRGAAPAADRPARRCRTDSLDHRYVVLLTRERTDARNEFRRDEELTMRRIVAVPAARSFGSASDDAPRPRRPRRGRSTAPSGFRTAEEGGLSLAASGRMPGNARARARAGGGRRPGHGVAQPPRPGPAVGGGVAPPRRPPSTSSSCRSWPTAATRCRPSSRCRPPTVRRARSALPPIADGPTELATTTVTVPVTPALVTDQVQVTVSGLRAAAARAPRGGARRRAPGGHRRAGSSRDHLGARAVAARRRRARPIRSGSTTRPSACRRQVRRATRSTAWPSKAGRAGAGDRGPGDRRPAT